MFFVHFRPIALSVVLGVTLPSGKVLAETRIMDSFSLKDRGAGFLLHKMEVEKGDVAWEASKNVILNGSKEAGYLSLADSGPFAARVPVFGDAKVISVEASLRVSQPDGGAPNWVAVGVGNPALGSPAWGAGVFLSFTGEKFLLACDPNPDDWISAEVVRIKSGGVPEFDPEGLTKLRLEYKVKTHTVSAWINGEQVCEDEPVPLEAAQVVPAFAGISGFGVQPNVKTAAGFSVKIAP